MFKLPPWLQDFLTPLPSVDRDPNIQAELANLVRSCRQSALDVVRYHLAEGGASSEQVALIDEMLATLTTLSTEEWNNRWYPPSEQGGQLEKG